MLVSSHSSFCWSYQMLLKVKWVQYHHNCAKNKWEIQRAAATFVPYGAKITESSSSCVRRAATFNLSLWMHTLPAFVFRLPVFSLLQQREKSLWEQQWPILQMWAGGSQAAFGVWGWRSAAGGWGWAGITSSLHFELLMCIRHLFLVFFHRIFNVVFLSLGEQTWFAESHSMAWPGSSSQELQEVSVAQCCWMSSALAC